MGAFFASDAGGLLCGGMLLCAIIAASVRAQVLPRTAAGENHGGVALAFVYGALLGPFGVLLAAVLPLNARDQALREDVIAELRRSGRARSGEPAAPIDRAEYERRAADAEAFAAWRREQKDETAQRF